jgi:hypothetical protein
LTILLVTRGSGGAAGGRTIPPSLLSVANGLIVNMGLLFVPAGFGIVAEVDVLRRAWLAILAGLVVSTVLGLLVTGLVMHHVARIATAGRRPLPQAAAEQCLDRCAKFSYSFGNRWAPRRCLGSR